MHFLHNSSFWILYERQTTLSHHLACTQTTAVATLHVLKKKSDVNYHQFSSVTYGNTFVLNIHLLISFRLVLIHLFSTSWRWDTGSRGAAASSAPPTGEGCRCKATVIYRRINTFQTCRNTYVLPLWCAERSRCKRTHEVLHEVI